MAGVWMADADPPSDDTTPAPAEVVDDVTRLKGGRTAGVHDVSGNLLNARSRALICGLHAVVSAIWQSGTIPPCGKRRVVVPRKGKRNGRTAATILSRCYRDQSAAKVLTHENLLIPVLET